LEEELIDQNPAASLRKYLPVAPSSPAQDVNPFSSVELAQYLAAMQAHYPRHYVYFLCLARTGMRAGEALGLFWEDMQFGRDTQGPHRFIHVQWTATATRPFSSMSTMRPFSTSRSSWATPASKLRLTLTGIHGKVLILHWRTVLISPCEHLQRPRN
jgi:integrase